jgi:tRNA threonylcarbamoyladenosine biosynthesis protein TsaB
VSTLAVLAQHAADTYRQQRVLAAIDARMGEAYVGSFHRDEKTGIVHALHEEQLMKLAELETPKDFFLAGSGFQARRDAGFLVPETEQLDEQLLPHAQALAKLAATAIAQGNIDPAGSAAINYLRNQVAEKSRKKVL